MGPASMPSPTGVTRGSPTSHKTGRIYQESYGNPEPRVRMIQFEAELYPERETQRPCVAECPEAGGWEARDESNRRESLRPWDIIVSTTVDPHGFFYCILPGVCRYRSSSVYHKLVGWCCLYTMRIAFFTSFTHYYMLLVLLLYSSSRTLRVYFQSKFVP